MMKTKRRRMMSDSITDPLYVNQWNLKLMQVEGCWNRTMGEGVVVGIIDSGVDASHLDLGWSYGIDLTSMDGEATRKKKYAPVLDAIRSLEHPKVLPGWSFVDDSDDTWDYFRHGTYLAGTICADKDGVGMVGVAPMCKIRPYVVVDSNGYTTASKISDAIRRASDDGCDVINISLAFWYLGEDDVKLLRDSVTYASKSIVVSATGNDNILGIKYPGKLDNVICVGGCDSIGRRWVHDSSEESKGSNWGDEILCVTPGASQVSTYYMRSRYTDVEGTSQSVANMCGVIALLKSVDKSITTQDVKDMIRGQGTTWNQEVGYGVPNASKLLSIITTNSDLKNELIDILEGFNNLSSKLGNLIGGIK
jgi:subtilisin family serine protease